MAFSSFSSPLLRSTLSRCFALRGPAASAQRAQPFTTHAAAQQQPRLASARLADPGVVAVTFAQAAGPARTALFHVPWLRDHCPRAAHPLTGQRALPLSALPQELSPTAVRCEGGGGGGGGSTTAAAPGGPCLRIDWPCGHASAFSAAWLQRYAYWWAAADAAAAPVEAAALPPPEAAEVLTVAAWWRDAAARDTAARLPWTAATFDASAGASASSAAAAAAAAAPPPAAARLPAVPYSAFMAGTAGLRAALRLLRDVGFVVLQGAPPTEAATEAACLRIGFLRPTLYGSGMWRTEVRPPVAGGGVTDTAFTAAPLPLHTDGNYLGEAPGLQVFHCTRADAGGGGDSLLLDGLALAAAVAARDPAAFALLTLWPLPYHHTGRDGLVAAARPVFALDAEGRVAGVHYNAADRGPVTLPPTWGREVALAKALMGEGSGSAVRVDPALAHPGTAIPAMYRALGVLEACLEDPALVLRLALRPGMVLVFDNQRVMHGRQGFDVTSGRTLVGCYLGRDEWTSKLREVELGWGEAGEGKQ